MRMLVAGNDVTPTVEMAPTVAHCVWLPGQAQARGKDSSARPSLRRQAVSRGLQPRGGRALLGAARRGGCGVAPTPLGFTLLELLLVVAIIAVASAGVSFALRDSGQTQLEREGLRLAALLESGRARSLSSGVPVRWRSTASGFVFDGLPAGTLPEAWLAKDIAAPGATSVLLGPEPIIGPQTVRLVSTSQPGRAVSVATDGVRPFSVQSGEATAGVP